MKTGHVLSGVLAGLLTGPGVVGDDPVRGGVYVILCSVGALVPDLDAPGATLSKSLPPITSVTSLFLCWLSEAVYAATRTQLDPVGKGAHRTLTHTAVFAPAAGLVCAVPVSSMGTGAWAWVVGSAICVGCWAHVAGDCCTETGCPVWWPIQIYGKRWKYVGIPKIMRFKTGKAVEKLLWTPALVLAVSGVAGIHLGIWAMLARVFML